MRKRIMLLFFLLLFVCQTAIPVFAFDVQFGDTFLNGDDFPEITWVVEHGWMDLKNNRFMTYEYVRKDEFAMILAKVAGRDKNIKIPTKPSFVDVPKTNKYFAYIEAMRDYLPYEQTAKGFRKYNPTMYITKEQAVASVIKALGYKTDLLRKYTKSQLNKLIADSSSVSKEYIPFVAMAVENGLVNVTRVIVKKQTQYYFYPKTYVDRGWLAYLLYMITIPAIENKYELFDYALKTLTTGSKRIDFRYSKLSEKDINGTMEKVDILIYGSRWGLTFGGGRGFESSNGYKAYSMYYGYTGDEEEKQKELEEKIQKILQQTIFPGMTDEEKIKAIHDYIVKNARYDIENYNNGSIPADSYRAYGVLVKGTGVCQGYAEAFNILAQMAGIPSIIISGEATNTMSSGPHAWNMIKVNNEVRYVDVTWDDPVPDGGPNYVRYDYFLLTEEQIAKDHTWDKNKFSPELLDLLQKYMK
ncbi:transglutaminase domain-containing protein [Anaerocellum danielii]|uniref:Transglutaminase domain-containing protein n=1 Tax=Anaerocellum danielii TaxID=1387557 RepID=A0ABZ0TXI7_9FIRM|nr:transglutaminase domain-containing protein [Caldicellulosiruptor danielii]WPX08140.1 transglutaminase domain-containing protein [Caldicellulosiruptor danielii]